jgi:metallopeptidase family M12-like protein
MRRLVLSAALIAASTSALAAPLVLDHAKLARLDGLAIGSRIVIDGFPDASGGASKLTFERVAVYAPGARLIVADANGEHEVPLSKRVELVGKDASGSVRVSLAFDPGVANVHGVGTSGSHPFVVKGERVAGGLRLKAVTLQSTNPAGIMPQVIPSDDAVPSGRPDPSPLQIALAGQAPTGSLRYATVAVDTDNEFMSERFSNNTTAAASWIADLFASMNAMYENDLNVMLQQGTTILRTTTDPYTQNDTPADSNDLDEFGTYWAAHYQSTPRAFAMLLSGKSSSGNQASGIAWINAYCATQSNGGSYSVNQVFTNPAIDVSYSTLIVGHELGHNFGAWHTHCTNVTTGNAPTGTNTIDKCYNEQNCYQGTTSCPTTGPGAPAGTIMSYCNVMQCGPTGQNVLQFHPTQVTTLNALIAQNTPSCLATSGGDTIFADGFD